MSSTSPSSSPTMSSSSSPRLKETSSAVLSTDEDTPKVEYRPNSRFHVYSNHHFLDLLSGKKEFICGWGSALINICVTFPINKLIFRQQLHGISGVKAFHQLHKDGVRFLYRGLLPPLFQKTTSISIMFGVYSQSKKALQELSPSMSSRSQTILSALIAGTLEASLTPFERVQSLMQAQKYHNKFSNTFDVFRTLLRYGPTEYYRGLSVIILRNGPSNCCFFIGREYLQVTDPKSSAGQKFAKDFVSGACLGALISTFFFPFNVVKTHMQTKLGGPFVSFTTTFCTVLENRDGKIRGLFKGVHLNYTRSFLSWGIINASYEILMNVLKDRKT